MWCRMRNYRVVAFDEVGEVRREIFIRLRKTTKITDLWAPNLKHSTATVGFITVSLIVQ